MSGSHPRLHQSAAPAPNALSSDKDAEMPATEKDLAEDAPWKKIQQNTFTRWCNEHLKCVNKRIGNLQTDLSDGLRLIGLLEVLSQKKMFRKYNQRPTFRQMQLENVSVALEFLDRENIKLVSIDWRLFREEEGRRTTWSPEREPADAGRKSLDASLEYLLSQAVPGSSDPPQPDCVFLLLTHPHTFPDQQSPDFKALRERFSTCARLPAVFRNIRIAASKPFHERCMRRKQTDGVTLFLAALLSFLGRRYVQLVWLASLLCIQSDPIPKLLLWRQAHVFQPSWFISLPLCSWPPQMRSGIKLFVFCFVIVGQDEGFLQNSKAIVDGNLKLILGLIWTLILHYSISMPMWDEEEEADDGKQKTPKQRLLGWIQNKLPELPITNFNRDWQTGRALGALVDSCAPVVVLFETQLSRFSPPGLCPDWDQWDQTKPVDNAREAMQQADDWLGIPQTLMALAGFVPNRRVLARLAQCSVLTVGSVVTAVSVFFSVSSKK
ncbi:hypothetical protein CCH79_00017929 [Gambusia affinis]|uniref:Calponin-homology (CH) domain-containing protein n=1 Tax=Gambusia affinis TaxID=33528 RepID=A0A315VM69_GAMAF|nr:hypothetical protein CCH79_00017929 [Gambusia affinis]